MVILLLLTLSFHLTNIAANACDRYNIIHSQQNDNITINFLTNNLLKLNRTIRCTSSSSSELINGCVHHCIRLGYGQYDRLTIEMQHDNGTIETCSIEYQIELQSPSLAYLNITNNKVRLGINRPLDSFDYVKVHCSNNESYIIFNTSIPSNDSLISVDCSFLVNMSLMNFLLETIKQGFNPAFISINQEVPLPISFTYSLNSRLLNVTAESPIPMNINSTYEFQVIFYDKNTSYERIKVSDLDPKFGAIFKYGLLPNVNHTIIFKHISDSIGYSQSFETILPIVSNISYPFAITNLHVHEEFNEINVYWNDTHDIDDPIEYIVLCNSSENSMRNVGRNTTYICENMTFNQTNNISVRTQIAIPGYSHNRVAVQMNVGLIPEIPIFEVFHRTENSITIQWNYTNNSLIIINSFQYKIKCSSNGTSIPIDIRLNQYQCQSLDGGTLYIITISIENLNNTIQRSKSIYANTLLQKCQIQNHFYSPSLNGTRSAIIEWNPPENDIDHINVYCPLSYMIFEYPQIMRTMFVKCVVSSGVPYNVTFTTIKSGYEPESIQFIDTPPVDSTTLPSITTITSPEVTTSMSLTTSSEVTTVPLTTTKTQSPSNGSSQKPSSTPPSDCSLYELLKAQDASTKWRTAAIVAFILAGFLFLTNICLIVFSVLLCLRNRYNDTDE